MWMSSRFFGSRLFLFIDIINLFLFYSVTIDLFYNGFCNNILWPLFHYIPPPMEVGCNDTNLGQWEAYYRANQAFVDAIVEVYDDK